MFKLSKQMKIVITKDIRVILKEMKQEILEIILRFINNIKIEI